MSWAVRLATPEDAPRIQQINHTALGYDYPLASTRERLLAVLMRPGDRVFVVCDEQTGTLAGYLHAADYEVLYSGSMKNILALAVEDAFRGLGLGKLLLHAAESWAWECGCDAVRLVSGFDRVQAHQFYQHCGYHLRKEEKNFIRYRQP